MLKDDATAATLEIKEFARETPSYENQNLSDQSYVNINPARLSLGYKKEKEKDYTIDSEEIVTDLDENWESFQTLEQIRQLPDDWDSYGSPRLSDEIYTNAFAFLCSLLNHEEFPEPSIGPVSGGGVQFEWQMGGRELEIEFSEPSQNEFLKVYEDRRMEEGAFSTHNTDYGWELVVWVMRGNEPL